MKRLIVIIALVSACGGSGPTTSPTPTLSMAQVADAYLAAATTADDAVSAAGKGLALAPVPELRDYCVTRIAIERTFVASLDEIPFPSGLAIHVSSLRDHEQALIAGAKACADAVTLQGSLDIMLSDALAATSKSVKRAAGLLRQDLQLPPTGLGLRPFH